MRAFHAPDGMSQNSESQPDAEKGISLEELSEAFAQMMGTPPGQGTAPAAEDEGPVDDDQSPDEAMTDEDVESAPVEPSESEEDDACPLSPQTILEAMLFVGNRDSLPLTAQRAAELMRDVEPEEISTLVDELNQRYEANGCPYRIVGEGAGYRLSLHQAFHRLRNRFYGRIREARLSQAAVDILAIVAYQQPLTGDEISRLRGKPSSHVLSQLVRRGLLHIERKQVEKRRVAQYLTTDRFLELFGMESLEDLPQSDDVQR